MIMDKLKKLAAGKSLSGTKKLSIGSAQYGDWHDNSLSREIPEGRNRGAAEFAEKTLSEIGQ